MSVFKTLVWIGNKDMSHRKLSVSVEDVSATLVGKLVTGWRLSECTLSMNSREISEFESYKLML